jgi:hypothetical protein
MPVDAPPPSKACSAPPSSTDSIQRPGSKDTLEKLPTWPNSRIDELLPFPPKAIKVQSEK